MCMKRSYSRGAVKLGLSTGRAGSGLGPTRTRPASVGWEGGGTRNRPPEKSVESVSGGGERRSSRSVVGIKKWHRNLKKKSRQNLEKPAEIWKKLPETGKTRRNLHFSLKIAWIFPNLAKSYQI